MASLESDIWESDLTLLLKDSNYEIKLYVHKKILLSRSEYFKGLLGGSFLESNLSEITLLVEDVCVATLLIAWIYLTDRPLPLPLVEMGQMWCLPEAFDEKVVTLRQMELDFWNHINIKSMDSLTKEIEELQKVLQRKQDQLKSFQYAYKDRRLTVINQCDKYYPDNKQECTCSTPLRSETLIPCYRHLSRYFENKGCFWCDHTDCSLYNC